MNKKLLSFSVLLCLLLSLASCGSVKTATETTAETTTDNTVRLTFPEGYTVAKIAAKLEENSVCSAESFMAEANNAEYLNEFGFTITDPKNRVFLLEGYLFPDTYDFFLNENPSSVIKKFLRNTVSKFSDEYKAKAKELGYSVDEILNLASVIQGESGGAPERGKVASVLYNRLGSSEFKRLQCDATISYLKNGVKPYVDEDRYDELCELYNTYMCYGLPAGPIGNPGIAAIEAALYPENTDYYYFVTDSKGVFYFAESWEQHLENCKKAGLSG